jgi:Spy/CpxP family protein refolding chaperone
MRTLLGVLFIAGNLFPGGAALADGNHGHGTGKSSYEGKMIGHHRSVSPLAMKEVLGLSEEQIKTLEPLESNYRKTSIKNRADLKITMIDLSALLDQNTPDKSAISHKVDEIGAIQKNMMQYRVDTMLELKKVLTPAQYEKFRVEIKEHMEHGMGGDRHKMEEMMHHGSKGGQGYGHEQMEEHHGK